MDAIRAQVTLGVVRSSLPVGTAAILSRPSPISMTGRPLHLSNGALPLGMGLVVFRSSETRSTRAPRSIYSNDAAHQGTAGMRANSNPNSARPMHKDYAKALKALQRFTPVRFSDAKLHNTLSPDGGVYVVSRRASATKPAPRPGADREHRGACGKAARYSLRRKSRYASIRRV